jgi:biofilm PGA synthesis N-glycosyltransferase PgaC
MPALPWWFLAVFVLGINFAIWGTVGAIRLTESHTARLSRRRRPARPQRQPAKLVGRPGRGGADYQPAVRKVALGVSDVAVLIPAHNEAAVLSASLDSIMALVPAGNIHVVSDGSTDDTTDIARQAGASVYETEHNVGKAGALREAIEHFRLIDNYQVVLLLDADTRVQPDYFTAALPLFDSDGVVAVAGCVRTARDRRLSVAGNVLVGHRERIYAIGQRALKFGQTYLRANATHIVPGFASMYRTKVLPYMDLNPPGLVIEDFNMTFEVYQKRLGKVAFTLGAVAETQDPDTLRDYVKQTRRWAVGLWQTVRRHPPRANLFTAMLAVLLLELITSSAIFLMLPLLILVLVVPDVAPAALGWPLFADVHAVVAAHMKLSAVLFGVALPDYALTVLVVVLERRPRLLLLGLFFPLLRIVDAAIGLSAIPAGWLVRSNGTWKSPARRVIDAAPIPVALAVGPPDQVMHASGAGQMPCTEWLAERDADRDRVLPAPVLARVSIEPGITLPDDRETPARQESRPLPVSPVIRPSACFDTERTHANR